MTHIQKYKLWCTSDYFDSKTKEELIAIKGNEKEIEDRFYKELEFGTGGLRGLIGAGSNRMNVYTIRKATQGIANYINETETEEKSVVIAYDSRNMSEEFAKETALCFNANGIKTYLFVSLRPTPELSFAVRRLNCTAGIVITASHNPAKYNGYKVYWRGGCQITSPFDKDLIGYVNKVTDYSSIKTMTQQKAKKSGLFNIIGEEIDNEFIKHITNISFTNENLDKEKANLNIVYTPLHGAGNIPVLRVLNKSGFKKVFAVKEQQTPNGDFPTVKSPNPEEPSAFFLALKYAKEKNADIVLATDPDADRLGLYVKDKEGVYRRFNGNMIASLMVEYILSQLKENNQIPQNGVIVKTIVTTNMLKEIGKHYNVETEEVLTGFKYIGEKINKYEEQGTKKYIFGAEESYGFLPDTYVRDKDALSSVRVLCEMCAYYKKQGKDLCEVMEEMYNTYGYYQEDLSYIVMKGVDGAEKIRNIMERVRENLPKTIGNKKVISVKDYLSSKETDLETNEIRNIELNKSDVLYFTLENQCSFCLRPSGTEPKIKLYTGVKAKDTQEATKIIENIKNDIRKYF